MDLKTLNWQISKQDLGNYLEKVTQKLEYVHGECLFWGKKCLATFWYLESSNKIKRIDLSFFDSKDSGPGTEVIDFKKIFNLLKDILGEPKQVININLNDLENLKDVYRDLNYEKLPKIFWEIEGQRIVLRFQDYWGIIPNTYIEKIETSQTLYITR